MPKPKIKDLRILTPPAAINPNKLVTFEVEASVESATDPGVLGIMVYISKKNAAPPLRDVVCDNVPCFGSSRQGNRFTVSYRPTAVGRHFATVVMWDRIDPPKHNKPFETAADTKRKQFDVVV